MLLLARPRQRETEICGDRIRPVTGPAGGRAMRYAAFLKSTRALAAMRNPQLICATALGGLILIVSATVLSAQPGKAPGLAQEISRVEAEIDQTFADARKEASAIPNDPEHRAQQVRILGKIMLF